MKQYISLILLMLLLSNCTSNNSSKNNIAEDELLLKEAVASNIVYPFGHPIKTETNELITDYDWYFLEQGEEREQLRKEANLFFREAYGIAAPIVEKIAASDKLVADSFIAQTNKYFANNESERALYIAKQMIASQIQEYIIPKYSLKDGLNRDKISPLSNNNKELLLYATELFIKNGNPNADLIAFNLSLLENSINKNLLREYAQLSIENANRWVEQQNTFYTKEYKLKSSCTSCEKEISNLISELQRDEKRIFVTQGMDSLQQYLVNDL